MEWMNLENEMDKEVGVERMLRVLYGFEGEATQAMEDAVKDAMYDLFEESKGGELQAFYLWQRFLLGKSEEEIGMGLEANMKDFLHRLGCSALRAMRHPRYAKRILKAV